MKPLSLIELASFAKGQLVAGRGERCANDVSADTRSILPGNLFIALRGERFDGHDYLKEAQKRGAVAAVVDKIPADWDDKSFGFILVKDTLQALQNMAHAYRKTLPVRIVAVTGSSGKSSTKEMIAAVLSQKFRTNKTKGNLNNHIGLPLTLLALQPEDEWAVVEMGMNHPGELAPLVALAEIEVAVITNVGWAHIEAFENQAGIALEKGTLVRALPKKGLAVLNADQSLTREMAQTTSAPSVLAGEAVDAVYRIKNISIQETSAHFTIQTPSAEKQVILNLPAIHMVRNAALALAVGVEMGVSLDAACECLNQIELPHGRCEVMRKGSGWLVDDTYNANPDSMVAGFEAIRELSGSGRSVALLGAMGELGKFSEELHQWVGRAAVEKGINILFAFGKDGRFIVEGALKAGLSEENCRWFETHEALAEAYRAIARNDDKVLIKGSRSQQMEKVLPYLKKVPCSIT